MNSTSKKAVVETNDVGANIVIHEFAIIRERVKIGNNVIIHPNVVIESGVEIGDNVEIFPGTYIGKVPKGAGALARKPEFNPFVFIGSDCSIGPYAVIYYDVRIGNNTLIGDGASIREKTTIGSQCIISRFVTVNYATCIGNRTKIMDQTHITGKCCIGNDVFISVLVSTANDNKIGGRYIESEIEGPSIGDCCRIGQGAAILPGRKIGVGALVGANSVVTKDVPEGAVVMGVPAKIVRYKMDK